MIFLRNTIKYDYNENNDVVLNKKLWITGATLKLPGAHVDFYVLYKSPKYNNTEFLNNFSMWLEEISIQGKNSLIVGDFNVNMLGNSSSKRQLENIILQNGFKQHVKLPTRIDKKSETCIDLMLSNFKKVYCKVSEIPRISDHEIISIKLPKYMVHRKSSQNKIIVKRKDIKPKLKCNDFNDLITHLNNFEWPDIKEYNIDILSNKFVEQFTSFPKLNPQSDSSSESEFIKIDPPYFNKIVKLARMEKINAFTAAKEAKNTNQADIMWTLYKRKRNVFVRVLKCEKKKYFENKIEENKSDPKKLWKVLKKMMGANNNLNKNKIYDTHFIDCSDGPINQKFNEFYVNSIKDIVDSINNGTYYGQEDGECKHEKFVKFNCVTMDDLIKIIKDVNGSSAYDCIDKNMIVRTLEITGSRLLQVINCAIETGCYPEWKSNMIIPVPKITNPTEPQHYRPINILPYYEKIVEKVMYNQMIKYVNDNNLLYEKQSGFRSKHSCETALQGLFSDWREQLDTGNFIITIMLDFKRAFETIDRSILLTKLKKFGFSESAHKLLSTYLCNRRQFTKINNEKSDEIVNDFGVPQGSILGPLLFIIYINDMHEVASNVSINLFADDTLVYFSGTNVKDVVNKLNNDLLKITEWLKCNKLKLNADKTKAMVIAKSSIVRNRVINELNVHGICIENDNIEFVNEFKYLGVMLDQYLNFDKHVNYIAKKVGKKIGVLSRLSAFISPVTCAHLYKSLIAPHFEYCSTIMWQMDKKNIAILQKLQNKAMRVIIKCHWRTHVVDMLHALNWMSITQRIYFNAMIFIFKMQSNLLPPYLCTKLIRKVDIHNHNLRNKNDFAICKQNSTTMSRSIYQSGLTAFNSLPLSIKNAPSLQCFKNQINNYILNCSPDMCTSNT